MRKMCTFEVTQHTHKQKKEKEKERPSHSSGSFHGIYLHSIDLSSLFWVWWLRANEYKNNNNNKVCGPIDVNSDFVVFKSLAFDVQFFVSFFFVVDDGFFFLIPEETKGIQPNSKHIFSLSSTTNVFKLFWCKCMSTYHLLVHLTMTKHGAEHQQIQSKRCDRL